MPEEGPALVQRQRSLSPTTKAWLTDQSDQRVDRIGSVACAAIAQTSVLQTLDSDLLDRLVKDWFNASELQEYSDRELLAIVLSLMEVYCPGFFDHLNEVGGGGTT